MASGIFIDTYSNVGDGVNMQVKVQGVPTGPLTFMISRTPYFADAYAPASDPVEVSANVYNVPVPVPDLFYCWAQDDNGVAGGEPGLAWVGLSADMDANLVAFRLRKIINDNKKALEIGLARYLPGTTIKSIEYGGQPNTTITDYPAILISEPTWNEEYVSFPYGKLRSYRCVIYAFIVHQDKAGILRHAAQFGDNILRLLNMPPYEEAVLESGASIYRSQCVSADATDGQLDDNKFAAASAIVWTADSYRIDTWQADTIA